MKWLRASLLSQGLLALYFQLIQWLPLGSWNYQPGFRPLGVEAIQGRATASAILFVTAFMAPFVVFWFAYSRGLRWLLCPDGGGAGVLVPARILLVKAVRGPAPGEAAKNAVASCLGRKG